MLPIEDTAAARIHIRDRERFECGGAGVSTDIPYSIHWEALGAVIPQ